MMVVAIVAILFVGPKELPAMLRTFGRSVKKIRAMASDFQGQFDDALKDAELDGVKDSINSIRDLDPTKKIKDSLNPLKADLEKAGNEIKQSTEFNPDELFDESLGPNVEGGLEVDVEAALDRQDAIDAEAKSIPPSSGKNAVPGFGSVPDAVGTPAKAKPKAKKAATKKTAAKKTTAKKPAAKKAAVKATAKKTVAKPAKKPGAAKPKAKAPAKRKPAKKADA